MNRGEWQKMSMAEQAEAWETMTNAERRQVRPDWVAPVEISKEEADEVREARRDLDRSLNDYDSGKVMPESLENARKAYAHRPAATVAQAPAPKTNVLACPSCGGRVSRRADKCPHCGEPMNEKSGAGIIMVLVGIIIVTALIIGFALDGADGSSSSPTATVSKTMAVDVYFGDDGIRVQNAGAEDLSGTTVTAYLNGRPPGGYRATFPGPEVGGAVEVPLLQFVDGEGKRLNPFTHAVTEAWIGGGGYDYNKYVGR